MKTTIFLSVSGYAILQKYIFTDLEYLKFLFIIVTIDLLTGLAKAVIAGGTLSAITNKGLRMTIKKLILYISFLIATHVLVSFTVAGKGTPEIAWVEPMAYRLAILFEIRSVYKNITIIDPRFDVVRIMLSWLKPIIENLKKPGIDQQ